MASHPGVFAKSEEVLGIDEDRGNPHFGRVNKDCEIREMRICALREKSERAGGTDVKEIKDVEEVKNRRLRAGSVGLRMGD